MDVDGRLCMILIYYDDLLLACQKKKDIIDIKTKISIKFECVDKGQVEMFLGMQIKREGEIGAIQMNQQLYIKDMLEKHNMLNCRPVPTPLDPGFQIACCKSDCVLEDPVQYQSVIGELMWLALTSRPDIYHSVVKLAQRNKEPHNEHVAAVKHLFRYLGATIDHNLNYRRCGGAL
ncbi:uncharacterized protein [Drosophila takahashii]|uniref:uncharacterized protein n=1 Tax=Drosophila takahashii TaxID=29030 RepID=UPI0038990A69